MPGEPVWPPMYAVGAYLRLYSYSCDIRNVVWSIKKVSTFMSMSVSVVVSMGVSVVVSMSVSMFMSMGVSVVVSMSVSMSQPDLEKSTATDYSFRNRNRNRNSILYIF